MAELEDEVARLAAEYEGDFYFREGKYEEALKRYRCAEHKQKIRQVAERCIKSGEGKGAIAAYAALEEKPSNAEWKTCGDACLKEGRIEDALFAYGKGNLVHELSDPLYFVVCQKIDRDQFRECGDICRGKGNIQGAARAYEVAERPMRIVAMADELLKIGTLPNEKEAKILYARAACLEIGVRAREELKRKWDEQAEGLVRGKRTTLFTSEELTRAAKEAARFEEEHGELPPVGRSPKKAVSREPLMVDVPTALMRMNEQVRKESAEPVHVGTPWEELELARVLTPGSTKATPEGE